MGAAGLEQTAFVRRRANVPGRSCPCVMYLWRTVFISGVERRRSHSCYRLQLHSIQLHPATDALCCFSHQSC